jgi:predicted DNA-binding transcriptional regulator AlpA
MILPEKRLPRAMSKKELCEFVGCYPQFLEKQIELGFLRARKLGPKKVVFLPEDIEEWMDSKLIIPTRRPERSIPLTEGAEK